MNAKKDRYIRQITSVICAKCGQAVLLDNSEESEVLVFENMNSKDNVLMFNCPSCKESYDLPCKEIVY